MTPPGRDSASIGKLLVTATVSPMKSLGILVGLLVLLTACAGNGEDGGDDGDDGGLTSEQRTWCTFTGTSESDAFRFDIIFEKGVELRLGMDRINATATALRDEYTAEGMSADDAVRAVSEDLFEIEDFVTACQAAYLAETGG